MTTDTDRMVEVDGRAVVGAIATAADDSELSADHVRVITFFFPNLRSNDFMDDTDSLNAESHVLRRSDLTSRKVCHQVEQDGANSLTRHRPAG